jgi:hypothetical protein
MAEDCSSFPVCPAIQAPAEICSCNFGIPADVAENCSFVSDVSSHPGAGRNLLLQFRHPRHPWR